jgi:hypothetical protein
MTEKDGSDGTKLHHYEDKLVELKPWLLFESARDINNEEYLSISIHELILFFWVQLPSTKEQINFNANGNHIDQILWLTPDELRAVLNREDSGNFTTSYSIKNKKGFKREKILFSQLEPFYPNELTGEGIVKEDFFAYKYLLDNIDTFCTY